MIPVHTQFLVISLNYLYVLPLFSGCVCVCVCARACALSHAKLFVTPRTAAHQAPLSLGFPRQKYWSGLPLPTPGDPFNIGIKPAFRSPALEGKFFTIWEDASLLGHLGST